MILAHVQDFSVLGEPMSLNDGRTTDTMFQQVEDERDVYPNEADVHRYLQYSTDNTTPMLSVMPSYVPRIAHVASGVMT